MTAAWVLAWTLAAAAQPTFGGGLPVRGVDGWLADDASATCVRADAALWTVGECAGWMRMADAQIGDYTVSFEVRSRRPGTDAFLGVLGVDGTRHHVERVMAFPIIGTRDAPRPRPIGLVSSPPMAAARLTALHAEGEWNAYRVSRNRTGLHVLLNGVQVASTGPVTASDGWIGFLVDAGAIEVRRLDVRRTVLTHVFDSSRKGELVNGAYVPGNGVALPKLRREVRPQYTADAMRAAIEGAVLVDCIVDTDGKVSQAVVARSLDPQYGLDAKAVEAARQWRFEPGTRDGGPVPVWISIELTFRLKK